MNEALVYRSAVTLTRNYPDLPFDTTQDAEAAGRLVSRTAGALADTACTLHLLRDMTEDNRLALLENGQAPAYMKEAAQTAAVLVPLEGGASVFVGGGAHVCISAHRPGMALAEAAADCFVVDDRLSRRVTFAFDEELGYLQPSHDLIGTGLRVSMQLHVPMLIRARRVPEVGAMLEKEGLRLTAAFPTAEKPGGDLLEISNASALGFTEQELCRKVTDAARRVCEMEEEARRKLMAEKALRVTDLVCRAWALMQAAHLMPQAEFWRLWSDVRLGAELKILPVATEQIDLLLPEALPAHLRNYAEEALAGEALDACRAARIHELLEENQLL